MQETKESKIYETKANDESPKSSKNKKRGIIRYILLGLLGIIIVFAAIMFVKVKNFEKFIKNGNVKKADMVIDTYGSKDNPSILLMHGMYMDGKMLSDFGQALSEDYYVIIPTLHGMEGAKDTVFDSFDGECESIEKYVNSELGGKLDYAYGISMGATTIYNLLQRDEIKIDKAILDGTYTANQGIFAAYMTSTNYYDFHVKALAGEDFDLGIMKISCVLMGISEEEGKAFFTEDMTKNPMTFENMSRASYANYTYRVDENASIKDTEVVLWCGSEEPYAIKSHNIIKPHLENYTEKIFEGYGHGELISNHTEECLDLIKKECQ